MFNTFFRGWTNFFGGFASPTPPGYGPVQLSKLLLTGDQFSSKRIIIEYGGRVTPSSISSYVKANLH